MTSVTKHVVTAASLVAIPAVITTKVVLRALEGPDFLDPTIPPPCWVPVHLHDRPTHVHAGGTASITVHLTNVGDREQTYAVKTNTPSVTPSTPALELGPLEHADIVLELPIAAGTPKGPVAPVVVTVEGCRTYRFRWLIHVGPRLHVPLKKHHHEHPHGHAHHVATLHEHVRRHHELHHPLHAHHGFFGHGALHGVDIHDRPDLQHHWYDHFYTECGCDHDR